jgi:hypothetical protein
MLGVTCISLLLFLTKSIIMNCPTKYAIDIKRKTTIVVADLRAKVGDNKSEVLASDTSNINAKTTIMQTMDIILFDIIESDRLNDAFRLFLPLSWGRLITLVPLDCIVK